jgi:hypothetical protein
MDANRDAISPSLLNSQFSLPERFREVIHGFGDVIKRVRKCFRVRPVTVSEAGVIGRDKLIAFGKPREQGFEHSG